MQRTKQGVTGAQMKHRRGHGEGSGYTGKWGGQEREVATFLSSWILFDALSLPPILPTTALSPLAVVPFFLFKCFN